MNRLLVGSATMFALLSTLHAAVIGDYCGVTLGSPGGIILDPDPPHLWAWPMCGPPAATTLLCQEYTNGWFSAINNGLGQLIFRSTCCQPGDSAEEVFWYDQDGNLVSWRLCCDPDSDTCVPL